MQIIYGLDIFVHTSADNLKSRTIKTLKILYS